MRDIAVILFGCCFTTVVMLADMRIDELERNLEHAQDQVQVLEMQVAASEARLELAHMGLNAETRRTLELCEDRMDIVVWAARKGWWHRDVMNRFNRLSWESAMAFQENLDE